MRIRKAPDFSRYLRHNFWDLFALLPFHGVFPVSGIVLLEHSLKLLNLSRILAFLVRPMRKARPIFDTNGFKYVLLLTGITVLTGGILIHFAEGMSIPDGIWWAFVTASTVGYGDISPSTVYGRMIAMVLMLLGIGLLGSVTSTLTAFFMKTAGSTVKEEELEKIKERLDHFDELSQEDVDTICTILKALKRKNKRT